MSFTFFFNFHVILLTYGIIDIDTSDGNIFII